MRREERAIAVQIAEANERFGMGDTISKSWGVCLYRVNRAGLGRSSAAPLRVTAGVLSQRECSRCGPSDG
jgi:pantoate kinase